LPASLIEAELFGNERGAYTDAKEARAGFIEQADGGTVFLDEIAELGLSQQSKLLTVFDDASIRRIGGTRQISVNVRFITATNEDLAELVRQRLFRQDLYYRCRVLTIRIPPLRERRGEIPAITQFLLDQRAASISDRARDRRITVSPGALKELCAFEWPGNIRELKAVLELAALKATGPTIDLEHLDFSNAVRPSSTVAIVPASTEGNGAVRRLRYQAPADPALERETIVAALKAARGNRTQAARALGMCRSVLWERVRHFAIDTTEWLESGTSATQSPLRPTSFEAR
jgi:DNA-binding NtrC family response regulator